MSRYTLLLATAFVLLTACNSSTSSDASKKDSSAVAGDSFTKTDIQYAKGLRIDYFDHYKIVNIFNHIANRTDTLRYLLLPAGVKAPSGLSGLPVVTIPVKTMAVLSSSHIGLAAFAGALDCIKGLGSAQYVNSPLVRERIKTGAIKEVGLDNSLNNELVIALHPDVLLTESNPELSSSKNKTLVDAGITMIPVGEWLETTALGRAEWVKLIAALVNNEHTVNKKFDIMASDYQRLAAIGQKATDHPSVIIGMPFKGSWFMPAGDSYMVKMLADAGASYHWMDSKGTGSLSMNFETVAPVALKADYWLNLGLVNSKADIAGIDSRFTQFASFRTGRIYNNTLRTNDLGSNDFWESGVVNPQQVLADMIRILHPDLLPKDSLFYYTQLK